MEGELEESIFDYVTERDLVGVLPITWVEIEKNRERLEQVLIGEYGMSDEFLIEEAMSEIIQTYELTAIGAEECFEYRDLEGWTIDDEIMEHLQESLESYDRNMVHSQKSNGIFLSVREADGEYVFNPLGWLLTGLGVLFVLVLIESAG